MARRPNILLIAIDSLSADHMSCYGYERLTTPHIDKFAEESVLFEQTFSPHVPTTPAYASMLTGRDCFGTQVVGLRHEGGLRTEIRTLPEMLREEAGYVSTCVGFTGNPSSRGFDEYLDYKSWGGLEDAPLTKAQNLNDVFHPELDRLAKQDKPWFVMLRHMDPHSPYLPPKPFEKMFYQGDEYDPDNRSMEPVFNFAPFADYFKAWIKPGVTDRHYVDALYDGAVAYMDSCIAAIFEQLRELDLLDDTIVVINGDHGETLYEHECWYDHHGMYENVLEVPLIIRYPKKLPVGERIEGYNQHKDLVPTLLQLAGVKVKETLDGRSLLPLVRGRVASHEPEFYISECTWMRKHGWRTPHWKLMVALEPDFHFKPAVELYDLVSDPEEQTNLARKRPDVVEMLRGRMESFIARREKQTGLRNPMYTQGDWTRGYGAPFESSQEAYDQIRLGNPIAAQKLQAGNKTKSATKTKKKS